MNSLFLKYFLIYSLVIVFSFVILGGAYVAQVNRYAVEDKENTLEQTASRAAESTSSFIETAAQLEKVLPGSAVSYTQSYLINMMQLADISNGMIFVGDVEAYKAAGGTACAIVGHTITEYVSNNDATCEEDGTKTGTCSVCGATETIVDEGSALGHSFGEYVSNNDATCEEDGTKTATCSVCGETDTVDDEGTALGHNYVDGVCTNCGEADPATVEEEAPAEDASSSTSSSSSSAATVVIIVTVVVVVAIIVIVIVVIAKSSKGKKNGADSKKK